MIRMAELILPIQNVDCHLGLTSKLAIIISRNINKCVTIKSFNKKTDISFPGCE